MPIKWKLRIKSDFSIALNKIHLTFVSLENVSDGNYILFFIFGLDSFIKQVGGDFDSKAYSGEIGPGLEQATTAQYIRVQSTRLLVPTSPLKSVTWQGSWHNPRQWLYFTSWSPGRSQHIHLKQPLGAYIASFITQKDYNAESRTLHTHSANSRVTAHTLFPLRQC